MLRSLLKYCRMRYHECTPPPSQPNPPPPPPLPPPRRTMCISPASTCCSIPRVGKLGRQRAFHRGHRGSADFSNAQRRQVGVRGVLLQRLGRVLRDLQARIRGELAHARASLCQPSFFVREQYAASPTTRVIAGRRLSRQLTRCEGCFLVKNVLSYRYWGDITSVRHEVPRAFFGRTNGAWTNR